MKPTKKVENTIRMKLRFAAGSTLRALWLAEVLDAQEQSNRTRPAFRQAFTRSPIVRLSSLAAVLAVATLSIVFWGRLSAPAYAIEQTIEALQNIRFLHIVQHDRAGRLIDERWIEIGVNGRQVRYRQDNPLAILLKIWENGKPTLDPNDDPSLVRMAVEDGESTAWYRPDRNAVILFDRKDMQFRWVGKLGEILENLRQEGKVLKENDEYQGRPAHKVWWPMMHGECYVDPQTKLPMRVGNSEFSYEEPPPRTFDIVIPEGYAVVDRRPGAAEPLPQWLQEEEKGNRGKEAKQKSFYQGVRALARGDYAEAAQELEQAIEYDTWAPFWLGSAYCGLGQYEPAIQNFTATLEFYGEIAPAWKVPYCRYARGLAYASSGNLEAAEADFQVCLPAMIETLRIPSAGYWFEYADNPTIRLAHYKPSDQEIVLKMINRLRLISGQNFGYDPNGTPEQNEAAIAAWEQWFNNGGQIQYTPEAELLPVPAAAPQDR